MWNTLSVVQLSLVLLLIAAILLQKLSSDSTANLASNSKNIGSKVPSMSVISKFTLILGICLLANSLLIARNTYQKHARAHALLQEIGKVTVQQQEEAAPQQDE